MITFKKCVRLNRELGESAYEHFEYQSCYDMRWYPMTKTMWIDLMNHIKKFPHLPYPLFMREKAKDASKKGFDHLTQEHLEIV